MRSLLVAAVLLVTCSTVQAQQPVVGPSPYVVGNTFYVPMQPTRIYYYGTVPVIHRHPSYWRYRYRNPRIYIYSY